MDFSEMHKELFKFARSSSYKDMWGIVVSPKVSAKMYDELHNEIWKDKDGRVYLSGLVVIPCEWCPDDRGYLVTKEYAENIMNEKPLEED